jgi:fucose permease
LENADARRRKLIAAGQIAFLPAGILTTLLGPMLPILSARWALNDAQAGKLFPVQFFAQLAGVLLSGFILARVGFRPAFLSGLLFMAAGVGTLYLGSQWLGFAAVAVYGLGLGLIVPTDNLMIAEVSLGSRSAAVSWLNFFWGVGAVLCALLVAWSQAHQLLPAFLGAVALLLLVLAVAVRALPFPGVHESGPATVPWKEILRNPVTWLFGAVFFLYPGAETCVGGWIGSYVTRMGAHEATMGALMPAFFWAALTAGRGAGGLFLQRLPERRILQAGFGAGSAGIALLLWSATLTGVIAGTMIVGLSFATVYPITVARLSQRYGAAGRRVGAIMFSLAALGPGVLPWLVGVISQSTGHLGAGLAVPFVATVILLLIHLREW